MRKPLLSLIVACTGILLLFSSLLAAEIVTTGEGSTKEQALHAAIRNAVEQGFGTFITSETKVQNFEVVQDRILSHSRGYVTRYTILKEETAGGTYRVTIQATVDSTLLKDDLEALGILQRVVGNPRILVAYSASGETAQSLKGKGFVGEVYNGIVEGLTDKQLRVADKKASEAFAQQVAETHQIDTDVNRAAAFGLKYDAEYTLYYDVSGEVAEGVVSKRARLRIKTQLVDNTRSQIITSKGVETTAAGQTIDMALERAARDAGRKVVRLMLDPIHKAWMDMQQNGFTYLVVVDGFAEASDMAVFAEKLEQFPAVNSSKEVESGGGKATFEAQYRGKREQLDRDIVRAATELGWNLKKVRSEGARSTWKKE